MELYLNVKRHKNGNGRKQLYRPLQIEMLTISYFMTLTALVVPSV